jgi:parvulin-like peptidyl-prolyl isomerase
MPPEGRAFYGGPGKHLLPQYLVQMKILSAEAIKQNLETQHEVQVAIQIARESILAAAAREQIAQTIPIADSQLQALYQQRKAEFEEVRIRHILLRTVSSILGGSPNPTHPPLAEAEARKKLEDLRTQILAGADFAQLARDHSDDLATAQAGGEMGYITRQSVLPPVVAAAYGLKPGQVSEVVVTPYGLELIQAEDKRTKSLEQVKSALETQIRQLKFEELFGELQKKYKVEVDAKFFAPQQKEQSAPADPPH